ncbi:neuropeptide SIFamide receptor-like [Narcine bancroftii]|uniref:neuropeptide SIFamide receptor-like n=1 Tax=Narcine bancroftii TaxID=1343680 RepID=UPI0038313147
MHGLPEGLLFAIYYPVVAAIGVPANLAVVVILFRRRCGLSGCITFYLVAMAVTDLLVIITAVILNRIVGIYFPFSFFFITPVCSVSFALIYGVRDCSVWATVVFTFDRYVAICCPKLKTRYCTKKTAVIVIVTVCVVSCLRNIPWYFIYEPSFEVRDVPWQCKIKILFYSWPSWAAFDWLHRILTPCLPFILILMLNALTVKHILVCIRVRIRLLGNGNNENQNDPEIESRRKSIVLLFCISVSFLLSWLLFFTTFLLVRMANVSYYSGSNVKDSNFILEESGFMLQLLGSCINPFIYTGTQNNFRKEMKNGILYPFNLIIRLFN